MDHVPTCHICGMEPETSHHAMVNCTKAVALRQCIRKDWELPPDHVLHVTGHNWMLILLSQISKDMRTKLLMLWWRTWHLRNNHIFGDGKCTIEHSSLFLQSYLTSFQDPREFEVRVDPKGNSRFSI